MKLWNYGDREIRTLWICASRLQGAEEVTRAESSMALSDEEKWELQAKIIARTVVLMSKHDKPPEQTELERRRNCLPGCRICRALEALCA